MLMTNFLEIATCFITSVGLLPGSSVSKQYTEQVTKYNKWDCTWEAAVQSEILEGAVGSMEKLVCTHH